MNAIQSIYTIMTFNFKKCVASEEDIFGNLPDITTSRVVGFYFSFDEADKVVRRDALDIWETIYPYAVIEKVEEGIYRPSLERWFYKYNIEKNEYEQIEEPQDFKHICGLTIG